MPLPNQLVPIVDAAIDHALRGAPAPPQLRTLIDWYESYDGDGWQDLYGGWDPEYIALKLTDLARSMFSDHDVLDELERPVTLRDSHRVKFARRQIADKLESDDCLPSIHSVRITNRQGEHAVLGWLIEIHGQAGAAPEFQGIFCDTGSLDADGESATTVDAH